jgi:hypothetical protein
MLALSLLSTDKILPLIVNKSTDMSAPFSQVLVMLVGLVGMVVLPAVLQVVLVVLQVVLQVSPCRRMCLLMGGAQGGPCWIHWDPFWYVSK